MRGRLALVSLSADPVPPDGVAPLSMHSEPPDEEDSLDRIDYSIPQVDSGIRISCDASARNLSASEYFAYVLNNVRPETQSCAEPQRAWYLYHAIRKALKAVQISFFPPNMAQNSRIVYWVIGTTWSHTQTDIIRR